jgi:DNA-directed RNA polymerase delta subunit
MNVLKAAEQVLTEAEKPLHYQEITKRVLQRQLWTTQGKTPDQTVNARLATNIKDYGTSSRFQRTGAGTFALRRWGLAEYPSTRPPSESTATSPVLSPGSDSSLSQLTPNRQTRSFVDAAEYVLEQFGNRKPMHYRDITEKALELGLLRTSGQTPEATLSARIGTEIARQEQRGEVPRFVRHGKGKVSLSGWDGKEQPRERAKLIKQYNDEVALDPWIYSLLELMKHAEEHRQANGEFDKRIALIGYDNAIEVSISTYLQLHPTQRGGASYQNELVKKWLANYHSLLDFFFDEFMKTLNQKPPVAKQNVIYYHNLRNDLYHEGKSLVPAERDIKDARKAALYIFSTLFKVKGEELIQTLPPLHM